MLKKRIIPCLDVSEGRTVKGVNFISLADAGDPVEQAQRYADEGADELVFLDITATVEKRKTILGLVEKVAAAVNIPFTVGGGISSVSDVAALLNAGADKISINSIAVKNKQLISDLAMAFGSQCIVVAIDTTMTEGKWWVYTEGGRTLTDLECVSWALEAERLGAGEILLTAIGSDGTQNGFALDITLEVSNAVSIPVIASGGAGNMRHFRELFYSTEATGALAASVFHYGRFTIGELKEYLKSEKIAVR